MDQVSLPAPIVDFDFFNQHRAELGKIVCTSGGYDPVHPGHLSVIVESKRIGDTVVVIVNGDAFLRAKKGRPFQDLITRCRIMSYARGADLIVPFEIENDMTVREALRRIRPHIFTKGGDRFSPETIPEWDVCKEISCEIITGVGEPKLWSSSDFLAKWKGEGREVEK
ncbi:adenylyltransferase/cytidyltransferase family protein [Patescibacteria group bacterium]|nr:adenylyltransferase/cytidyltransferase family protein [Patescibacteria group bacterium]MBU1629570.1 adenylyltransferase/cytidyltransferase family protein [Patescibacteria group bacterium]